MSSDQAQRIIKTGGPLEIWKREMERKGEDYISPVVEMLGDKGMEIAMATTLQNLETRFNAWGPAQYIKGFPQDRSPNMVIEAGFDGVNIGIASYFIELYPDGAIPVGHYKWSPKEGFRYNKAGILRFLLLSEAWHADTDLDMGGWRAKVTSRDNTDLLCYSLTHSTSQPALFYGHFESGKVLDYNEFKDMWEGCMERGCFG